MQGAFDLATQAYDELIKLYNQKKIDKEDYLKVAKKYANLTYHNSGNTKWELNGNTYTMYHLFKEVRDLSLFAEDVSMMVYRLNGGEGYTTYQLVEEIRDRRG